MRVEVSQRDERSRGQVAVPHLRLRPNGTAFAHCQAGWRRVRSEPELPAEVEGDRSGNARRLTRIQRLCSSENTAAFVYIHSGRRSRPGFHVRSPLPRGWPGAIIWES